MPGAEASLASGEAGDILAAAVREAGALAMAKFRSSFKSWTKEYDSPVSEVDIAADALLRERLMGAAPGYGWLSEESTDGPDRLDARHVWIVDPIDGTRAFIAGREDWAVSAALTRDGRPVAGALYAPAEDALFLAVEGAGATLNGRPLAVGAGEELDGLRLAGPKRYADLLARKLRVEELPRIHSLALRLARVSTGAVDVAVAGGNSHDWDLAAADIIVHEAGGVLSGLDGEPVVYNRAVPTHGILVAAGRARHRKIIKLMR